ncbi:brain enriched myelin associated protein 1 [Phyllostomus discolor]|uniref:Brain enriched myelin associated protein 1 n=1 Tax=Phyllostomus discolor TaxID=89673 RepID=A0A833Z705_9CHIR|nr:brain enriched myelin associated protein 1 [Phyllostomus discolor]
MGTSPQRDPRSGGSPSGASSRAWDQSGCWMLKCKQTPYPLDPLANPSKQIATVPTKPSRHRDASSPPRPPQTLSTCIFPLPDGHRMKFCLQTKPELLSIEVYNLRLWSDLSW